MSLILLTGGTGSFGQAFVDAFARTNTVRVFSRSELLQTQMAERFNDDTGHDVRFLIGDVQDVERLTRAARGVDVIVHAAAMKHVPVCEYNPWEAVQTNVHGAQNVVEVAYHWDVPRVIALSTDKAVNPINLYGATKLCAEKIILGAGYTVIRYGNVLGSRGSVVHSFREQARDGLLRITHPDMTRFVITMAEALELVRIAMDDRLITKRPLVPTLPWMAVVDLAEAMYPALAWKATGIRPGEKLHETLLSAEENHGVPFVSGSTPTARLSVEDLRGLVAEL